MHLRINKKQTFLFLNRPQFSGSGVCFNLTKIIRRTKMPYSLFLDKGVNMKKKIACLIVFLLVLGSCTGSRQSFTALNINDRQQQCLQDYEALLRDLSKYSPTAESLQVFYKNYHHLANIDRSKMMLRSTSKLTRAKDFFLVALNNNFKPDEIEHYLGASYQSDIRTILLVPNSYPPLLQALGFCHGLMRAELYQSVSPDSNSVPFNIQVEVLTQFGLSKIINEYTHGNWVIAVNAGLQVRQQKLWQQNPGGYDQTFDVDNKLLALLFPKFSQSELDLLKSAFILDINTRRIVAKSDNMDFAFYSVCQYFNYYYRDKVPGKNE